MAYHLFKGSRFYHGFPYCGPTSGDKPAVFDTLEEALEAQKDFTYRNPVGWEIYDEETGDLVAAPLPSIWK